MQRALVVVGGGGGGGILDNFKDDAWESSRALLEDGQPGGGQSAGVDVLGVRGSVQGRF